MLTEHLTSGSRRALLLFTRHPALDVRRKQLVRNPDRHLAVYRHFIQHLLTVARHAQHELDFDIVFASDEQDRNILQGIFAAAHPSAEFRFIAHQACSFDCNFKHALQSSFDRKYRQVTVIGNDCPDLSAAMIMQSFRSLDQGHIALGAARDGGFYLLGISENNPDLFNNIQWGSHTVLATLSHNIAQLRQTIAWLPKLADIDSADDLRRWIMQTLDGNSQSRRQLARLLLTLIGCGQTHHYSTVSSPYLQQLRRYSWQLPPPIA